MSRARLDGSDKIDIYVDPWGGAGQGGQTMYSIAVAGNRLFIGYFGGNITVSTMGGPAPLASANFATLEASQVVNALGMGADSTHLYYSNESPLSSIGRARLDGSAPPEPSFIPTGNGSNIRPWAGSRIEPPPLPVPTTAQTPKQLRDRAQEDQHQPHLPPDEGQVQDESREVDQGQRLIPRDHSR